MILSEFVQVQIGQVTPDQLTNSDPIQGIVGLLQSGLGVVTAITFLKWVYRAYKNVQGFGAEGLRFSPGWAIGLLFHSDPEFDSPGAGDERNLASQLRSQKLAAKPWFMADCDLVDLVFALLGGNPSLTADRDPGLDERPMDTGRGICDSWAIFSRSRYRSSCCGLVTEIYKRQKDLVEGATGDDSMWPENRRARLALVFSR